MSCAWLQKEYREFLLSGCSREDLLYVYENLFSIREKMGLLQEPKHDQYVLFEGREQILYLLSSDPSLKNPLLDTLKEEGKRAREMLAEWNTIYSSRREVHEVRDENMSDFYRFRFRNHLDSDFRQRALEQDFLRANTSEALEAVITGALGEMIQRDEIFRASFEEELAQRFGYRKLEIDIGAYVRKSLTVENMHIYFRSLFDLGDPVFSAISLKTGSRLHESLRENIGSDTYYYNTGISTEISTVKIYLLHLSNLIRSKE